jgi:hypothetical protein
MADTAAGRVAWVARAVLVIQAGDPVVWVMWIEALVVWVVLAGLVAGPGVLVALVDWEVRVGDPMVWVMWIEVLEVLVV